MPENGGFVILAIPFALVAILPIDFPTTISGGIFAKSAEAMLRFSRMH